MEPPTTRPGGSTRPMIENPVTDLPEPDSPTRPSTSPRRTLKETSSTARTTPARVKKWVRRLRTSSVGAAATVGATVAVAVALMARLSLQARVQHVPQLVADEVDGDDGDQKGDPW